MLEKMIRETKIKKNITPYAITFCQTINYTNQYNNNIMYIYTVDFANVGIRPVCPYTKNDCPYKSELIKTKQV